MGHNDHIDFDLDQLIEELKERGYLDESDPDHALALEIAEKLIHEQPTTDAERKFYDVLIVPLLERLEKHHEDEAMQTRMEQDD